MNNNKLHYYLPHKIKMTHSGFIGDLLQVNSNGDYNVSTSDWWHNDNDKQPYKPLLYPLSCLTETIIHNGVEEIPLVELAKIEGKFKGKFWDSDISMFKHFILWKDEYGRGCKLDYYHNSFHKIIGNETYHVHNQLLLFDYCYSRRINIWGIDAIDPRTLEVNPYLI